MTQIILATSSPHRKRFFSTLGLDFIAEGSNVDEYFEGRPSEPQVLVKHLAKLKAEAVAKNYDKGIVIGFDSVAYFQGEILEKPKTREEDFERLKKLSGNSHEFYTGIYIINLENSKVLEDVVETKVWFRNINNEEINKYLDQDLRFITTALGYSPPEHYSSSFLTKIEGCYNNICWGLPLGRIVEMMKEVGWEIEK